MRALPIAFAAALAAVGSAQAAGGGGGGDDGLNLIPLGQFRAPIVDSGRVVGVLQLRLVLQGVDAAAAAHATHALPKLRAAALGAALDFAATEASSFRPVDVALLDRRMTAAMQAVDPGIGRVLIVEVGAAGG